MEDIEAELESKSIERIPGDEVEVDNEPEPVVEPVEEIKEAVAEIKPVEVVKKSKKVRSQKQIEAFEKARKKRAEILAEKKLQKEAEKEQKKEEKKALKKAPPPPVDTQDVNLMKPMSQGGNPVPHPVNPRHEVVNNYYYYNVEPDHHETPKRKKKKSKRRPPTPSSSESESSDEEEEEVAVPHQSLGRQPQQYYAPPKPTYKFSYA